MGILERIEAKLDQLLAAQGNGQSVDLNSFAETEGAGSPTAIVGTAPQPSAAAVGETELDAAGFPWDARIHASSKEKVAAGTWKYKRGVEQNVKDSVENEFRAAGYGADVGGQTSAPAAPAVPVNGPAPVVVAGEQVPQQPQVPAAPVAGAGVNLPGLTLPTAPAPVAAPEPVKVQMPAWVEGAELDDSQITAVAAAAYAKLGEQAFAKLQGLFKMAPGTAITELPAEFRDSFHRVAADDTLLAHYQIV